MFNFLLQKVFARLANNQTFVKFALPVCAVALAVDRFQLHQGQAQGSPLWWIGTVSNTAADICAPILPLGLASAGIKQRERDETGAVAKPSPAHSHSDIGKR